jgi:choline dehydrogenase-like flavoprotein
MNNPNGVRMSTALTYINPNRHRLNLTIRPNVQVQRILFDGLRASGVEVESGGERFNVEGAGVSIDYTFQVKAKLPQLKKPRKAGKKS